MFGGRAEASLEIVAWSSSVGVKYMQRHTDRGFCNVLSLGELGVQELAFEGAEGHFLALCEQMFGRGQRCSSG